MAEKRMFAQRVVLSDVFVDLSVNAKLLYFVIGVVAQDKGIVANAKSMARAYGIDPELPLNELVTKEFLIPLEHGKYQIVHWYENNGIGETAKKRNNYSYRKWREAVLDKGGYKCTNCGCTEDLQAHHIKEFAKYPALRFEVSNGITLCRECHRALHKKERENGTV